MALTLKDLRALVDEHKAFKALPNKRGSINYSVFAVDTDSHYVVYSYGWHFPMYAYDKVCNVWLANQDKCSVSTTRHQSKCRPTAIFNWQDAKRVDTSELRHITERGKSWTEYVLLRGEVA